MLLKISKLHHRSRVERHLRLTLEILHDVQEFVIYVGLFLELNLDLVKVAQGVLQCSHY